MKQCMLCLKFWSQEQRVRNAGEGATPQTVIFQNHLWINQDIERKLSLTDEIFLTMIRLKGGLLTENIAQKFNVSVETVSSVISSWVNLMYTALQQHVLFELPPKEGTDVNPSKPLDSTQTWKWFSTVENYLCKIQVNLKPENSCTQITDTLSLINSWQEYVLSWE